MGERRLTRRYMKDLQKELDASTPLGERDVNLAPKVFTGDVQAEQCRLFQTEIEKQTGKPAKEFQS